MAGLVLGFATASLPTPAAPAAVAAPAAGCASSGDVVAVDLRPWGGNLKVGCDARLTTGLEALHVAGFTTAGDDEDGDAFVCRIDDYPPPSQESCATTPPASAYWSYWHADAGQTRWSYSNEGAASYRPTPGSIDAWVFGATDLAGTSGSPTFSPSQVRTLERGAATSASGSSLAVRSPERGSTGSSRWAFAWGAVTIVVLGLVGALLAWRRRRADEAISP